MISEASPAVEFTETPEAEAAVASSFPLVRRKKRLAAPPAARRSDPHSRRLTSLDAFRGLAIVGMLLVNNVALDTATPRPLTHAPWNGGVYFADLVYPWFLLIVGVAIPFSAAAARARGVPCW